MQGTRHRDFFCPQKIKIPFSVLSTVNTIASSFFKLALAKRKNSWHNSASRVVRDTKWEAGLAQLVEQRIRNAKVGSSSLLTGTILKTRSVERVFCFQTRPSPADASCRFMLGLSADYLRFLS